MVYHWNTLTKEQFNALLAEHVMGWTRGDYHAIDPSYQGPCRPIWIRGIRMVDVNGWHPSDDLDQAFRVFWMGAGPSHIEYRDGGVSCQVYAEVEGALQEGHAFRATGDPTRDLCEAIGLAALRLRGVTIQGGEGEAPALLWSLEDKDDSAGDSSSWVYLTKVRYTPSSLASANLHDPANVVPREPYRTWNHVAVIPFTLHGNPAVCLTKNPQSDELFKALDTYIAQLGIPIVSIQESPRDPVSDSPDGGGESNG